MDSIEDKIRRLPRVWKMISIRAGHSRRRWLSPSPRKTSAVGISTGLRRIATPPCAQRDVLRMVRASLGEP